MLCAVVTALYQQTDVDRFRSTGVLVLIVTMLKKESGVNTRVVQGRGSQGELQPQKNLHEKRRQFCICATELGSSLKFLGGQGSDPEPPWFHPWEPGGWYSPVTCVVAVDDEALELHGRLVDHFHRDVRCERRAREHFLKHNRKSGSDFRRKQGRLPCAHGPSCCSASKPDGDFEPLFSWFKLVRTIPLW